MSEIEFPANKCLKHVTNYIIINDIYDLSRPRGQERGIRAYSSLTALILSLFRCIVSLSYIQAGKHGRIYAVNTKSFEKFKNRTGYQELSLETQQATREMARRAAQSTISPTPPPAERKQVANKVKKPTAVTTPKTVTSNQPPKQTGQEIIEKITKNLERDEFEHYIEVGQYIGDFKTSDKAILEEAAAHFKNEGFVVKLRKSDETIGIVIKFPRVVPSNSGPIFAKCRAKFRELFLEHIREVIVNKAKSHEIGVEHNYDDEARYFKAEMEKCGNCSVEIYKHVANLQTKNIVNNKHYVPGQNYLRISFK